MSSVEVNKSIFFNRRSPENYAPEISLSFFFQLQINKSQKNHTPFHHVMKLLLNFVFLQIYMVKVLRMWHMCFWCVYYFNIYYLQLNTLLNIIPLQYPMVITITVINPINLPIMFQEIFCWIKKLLLCAVFCKNKIERKKSECFYSLFQLQFVASL